MDSKCNHNINNNINNINYHLQLMETFEISFLFKNIKTKNFYIIIQNLLFFFVLFIYYVFAIILFILILLFLKLK